MSFLPWLRTKMGLSSCCKVRVLLVGLLCINQVWPMTLSKPDHQTANELADESPKLPSIHDIKVACPVSDTYCIPRTRCVFRSVVYDREGLRFMQGADSFEDKYGCGAFTPTETFVCCATRELLGPQVSWYPTSSKWFFPSEDVSQHARNADSLVSIPNLAPWPAFKEFEENIEDDLDIISQVHVKDSAEAEQGLNLDQGSGEPATDKSEEINQRTEAPSQTESVVPPSQSPQEPRLFNSWAMNPSMDQQPMFPPLPNFNSMFFPNPLPEQFVSSRWMPPRSDWVEMILIFPDGSVQRTIKESRPLSPPPTTEQTHRMAAETPNLHFESLTTTAHPIQESVHQTERSNTADNANQRGRRATETKAFKVEPARGGLWTGNVTSFEDEREGRALVPPPKAIWGLPGSGNVPVFPMSSSFNVNSDRCGMSSSSGINARILAGRKPGSEFEAEANMAEFPWHVGIINGETGNYLCGGAIISGRFVVTVAHCVRRHQMALLFVRVGDWDLSVTSEMFPSYDVEVLKVFVHEEYNAGNMQNDIALLQLKYPLDFVAMPHVGSICLPPPGDYAYTDCIVTGWGQQSATNEGKADVSAFSRTLRKTSQTLVTHQFCERSLRPYLGQFYQLPMKGFICAYDKDGKDSCFGDGGGALACAVNSPTYGKSDQYHVVGLVSWGVGCGIPGVPAVYTNMMHYRDWIHAKVFPIDPYPIDGPVENIQPTISRNPAIMLRSGKEIDENQVDESSESSYSEEGDPLLTRDFIDLAFN